MDSQQIELSNTQIMAVVQPRLPAGKVAMNQAAYSAIALENDRCAL